MNYCFSFGTLLGLLLLFWRVLCLFSIVQEGLVAGFPQAAFLLMGMLLVGLLKRVGRFMLCGWSIVLMQVCLASMVVVELTGLVNLVEALKESY